MGLESEAKVGDKERKGKIKDATLPMALAIIATTLSKKYRWDVEKVESFFNEARRMAHQLTGDVETSKEYEGIPGWDINGILNEHGLIESGDYQGVVAPLLRALNVISPLPEE